jgi:O-antigen/teichoic acid export membrane protein
MPAVDGRVMTSGKRRAIGASGLTVADVASKAVTFLITPYLANRLGAAEFGILNLYLAIAQILSFVIAFGGAGLLAAEYVRRGYTAARQMRSVNLRLSAYASAALAVIGLAV